jgi:hypothetical protein
MIGAMLILALAVSNPGPSPAVAQRAGAQVAAVDPVKAKIIADYKLRRPSLDLLSNHANARLVRIEAAMSPAMLAKFKVIVLNLYNSQTTPDPNANPPLTYPGTGGGGTFSFPVPSATGGYDTVNTVLYTTPDQTAVITYAALAAMQQYLQGVLDSENEMSEMTSMDLQMTMDRRDKCLAALANYEKRIASIPESVVSGLK